MRKEMIALLTMNEADAFIAGAISGAITDPISHRALTHAKLYYDEIRKNHSDVERIANNTGFPKDQIMLIKNYLFMDVHELEDGIHRFDFSFEIAESWRRLAFDPNHIQKHDLTLLNHELMEMRLVVNEGLSQDEAHVITSQKYNYSEESSEYYAELHMRLNREDDAISGAIRYLGSNTH